MKQIITHVTHYRYTAPVTYSIQTLRLTPRDDEHQRVPVSYTHLTLPTILLV